MHFFNNVEYLNSEIVNFVEQINKIFIKGSNSIGLYKTVNYLNNMIIKENKSCENDSGKL